MNSYTKILSAAVTEMTSYAATDSADMQRFWAGQIARVKEAAASEQDSDAEDTLSIVLRLMVDNGPVGDAYSPSLSKAFTLMDKKQKR